jgi:cytidyltransferase-like protein
MKMKPQNLADVAIVPGSFKPPHAGHFDMVKKYAAVADEVLVLVSDPKTSGVRTVNDQPIEPSDVVKIFELFAKSEGISNVRVEISPVPSPVKATYDYIEACDEEKTFIVGASKKPAGRGLDCDRWKTIVEYMKDKNPKVSMFDPIAGAVHVNFDMSSEDFREALENDEEVDHFLPKSVMDDDDIYDEVMDVLNGMG